MTPLVLLVGKCRWLDRGDVRVSVRVTAVLVSEEESRFQGRCVVFLRVLQLFFSSVYGRVDSGCVRTRKGEGGVQRCGALWVL